MACIYVRVCTCEFMCFCKIDWVFLLYKVLIGTFSNYSSKIFVFFILAPEKIVHEKLEEEVEMELKGTITNENN